VSKIRDLIPPIATALCVILAGCAETPKSVPGGRGQSTVNYKIGTPYQVAGIWYYPKVDYEYAETGIASWYGDEFHGRETANGEIFDKNQMTAAHRTLPMPSAVKVTNLANGRSAILRVNDRGPFAKDRIIDVSRQAAKELGFLAQGTARVRVDILANESRQLAALGATGALTEAERAKPAPVTSVTTESLSAPRAPTIAAAADANVAPTAASPAPRVAMAGAMLAQPSALGGSSGRRFIQAASFRYYDNAARLAGRLSPLGPTRVVPVEVEGEEFYRVWLGPVHDDDAAAMLLDRVVSAGQSDARIIIN